MPAPKYGQATVFVSKRFQPPVAAMLCLMAMQLMNLSLSTCHEAPMPLGAVRVAITR
ncbi:MAG: hypothetical protein M3N05_09870 [Pseudomonadota bacterium]|nr:hypothetical protein [Pseudomonadota bacterium]